MEENFDITSILEVSYEDERNAQRNRSTDPKSHVDRRLCYPGEGKASREIPTIQLSDESCDGDGEVILGLVPSPDWVENRPLREGADIELAAAKRSQMCKGPEKSGKSKPKKEVEEDESEDLVIDYEDQVEDIMVKEEEELQINDVIHDLEGDKTEGMSDEDQNNERKVSHEEDTHNSYMTSGMYSQAAGVESQSQGLLGCNSCPASFSDSILLGKHVKTHPPRRKSFICRLCLKPDSQLANLKRHLRTHFGEKPFACTVCSKPFTTSYSLKIHMRIHSGYKPYNCDHCPRSFYQKNELNRHLITHMKSSTSPMLTSQESITVEAANDNSSHVSADLSHPIQSHHLTTMENMKCDNMTPQHTDSLTLSYKASPYKCDYCPRSFCQKTDLDRHSITHPKARIPPMHTSHDRDAVKAGNDNLSHVSVNVIPPVQAPQLTTMENMKCDNVTPQNAVPSTVPYKAGPVLVPNSKGEVVLFQGNNGVTVTCKLPFENGVPVVDQAFHSTNSKDKQQSDKNSVSSQSLINPESSQNKGGLLSTTNNSSSHLLVSEERNSHLNASENSVGALSQAETVGSVMYPQPSSESFCIPVYLNGQLYYIIPSMPSQPSDLNAQSQVQTTTQPTSSQKLSPQELSPQAPLGAPPVTTELRSTSHSSGRTAVLNSTPFQQEQRPILCDTCKAPVTVYTG